MILFRYKGQPVIAQLSAHYEVLTDKVQEKFQQVDCTRWKGRIL